MTWQRDLAWENLEFKYRSSVAAQFARYALTMSYEKIPQDVIHQAKRCLLDALGCAIGAWDAPGRPLCEALAEELGGRKEATIFGSGTKTGVLHATLVNSLLVRFLDYNDYGGGGHNSDAIPALLAVAEREGSSGKDLLTSIVISYELGDRVLEAFTGSVMTNNWCIDARGGLNMPPALGKLLQMDEDQIANAIGLCTSHALPLNILDANREENVMAKNLRFGWVAHDAIISCLLARRGFTGPLRIFEGDSGFGQVIMRGEFDLEKIADFSGWRTLRVKHKSLCANATTQGGIYATLGIVKENDLKPEDIASVKIKCTLREAQHTTTPAKKYPRNAESADHSAFYANAVAIKERSFGPDSFDPVKFTDPVILDLIEKITIEADPALPPGHGFPATSEIVTRDGRKFSKRVDYPHGFGDDPMTDADLEAKFRDMAKNYMPEKQINDIFETVWNTEKLSNLEKLMSLMIFSGR